MDLKHSDDLAQLSQHPIRYALRSDKMSEHTGTLGIATNDLVMQFLHGHLQARKDLHDRGQSLTVVDDFNSDAPYTFRRYLRIPMDSCSSARAE